MMFLRLLSVFLFKLLGLPLQLLLILVAPAVFAFVPREWDRMPDGILRLWDEYTYGINGDAYWVDASKYDHPHTEEAARSWFWRVLWFIRNGNVMDHWQACRSEDVRALTYSGNPDVSDAPLGSAGLLLATATAADGRSYDCAYLVWRWSRSRCLRFQVGYKLKELVEFQRTVGALPYQRPALPVSDVMQRVLYLVPWKRFYNVQTGEGV